MTDQASSRGFGSVQLADDDVDTQVYDHAPHTDAGMGVFDAELFYVAADLEELSESAPAHKRQPLAAICRLLRALASSS